MSDSKGAQRDSRARSVAAVAAAVDAALTEHASVGARVALALSGGVDSMVLLDATVACAAERSLVLSAIHVNHGISPNAERWADFCAAQCASRNVPLTTFPLRLERQRGQSLEAVARAARYECLFAADVDVIVLAHHADDQAETLLLQLLRGAGPHGLAAMPRYRAGRPALLRPLLGLSRASLGAYATARGLAWIDDESNADRRLARNFIRHEVAPLLAAKFPGYPATLARAARHQIEAAELADELAVLDAAGSVDAGGLDRARLEALSPSRARNLLRWFLRSSGLRPPSERRLADMLRQLRAARSDTHLRIEHDGAEIGCHRGLVVVHVPSPVAFARVWEGESELRLPGGMLRFERTRGTGVAVAKLAKAPVTLRSRSGGERIRLAANRPTRPLKKLLQEARIPMWQREALPIVWSGEQLVAVPGIGVALAFQAEPNEEAWQLEWRPMERH
jgi:tRNA(Ile)-lysidine synthase